MTEWFSGVGNALKKLKKEQSFMSAAVPHIGKKENKETMLVDISSISVAKGAGVVLLILLLFYFLYNISGILLIFFISFLFAGALDPVIDKMEEWKLPRPLSMLFVYVLLFIFMGFFVTQVVTLLADQVIGIAQSVGHFVSDGGNAWLANLPFGRQLQPYFEQFAATVDVQAAAAQLQNAFQILSTQLVSLSFGLFNFLIVLVLTFFMVVEEKSIEGFFQAIFPARYGEYISTRMVAVKDQIGLWLRGQLLLSIIAGVISYIVLAPMGVNYALTLAFIAGIAMVVPVVGRFFAWVVTFPIVFNQSPSLALWMSIFYLIIQQFENNLIVPYVMNKAVGLNPIVIIFALMVGGQYLGVLGFILAIPIATTLAIFIRDFAKKGKM
ncbi:AI-2E family transporter [Patescibacteria group bacterium]|nr:AI-2E family transporter [Patescibacteria group bacterium]